MNELVYDSVAELIATAGAVIGSVMFTLVGLLTEQAGIHNVLTGHSAVGLWEVYMGGLALFVGIYLLGYHNVWRRLRNTPAH